MPTLDAESDAPATPIEEAEEPAGEQPKKGLIRFRPDIEGLRAVAVLMVVLDHLHVPGFGSGFVGVDVFFVISGFLITSLLASEYRKRVESGERGRVSIRDFYRRRALRILPAATTVIAACLIAGKFLLSEIQFIKLQADALWATFFGTNIQLIRQASDYFQRGIPRSPLQNFWSLAVEEQFYVVWPITFAVVAFVVVKVLRSSRWLLGVRLAVAAIGVASLVWSIHQAGADPAAGYFSTLTRAWQLALGGFIALTPGLASAVKGRRAVPVGLTGLALLGLALVFCSSGSGYPGAQGLLPAGGAALLICAGLVEGAVNPAGRLLALRVPRFIGRISYSLYLWHWPLIIFAGLVYGSAGRTTEARLVLLVLSFAVAILSRRLIEQPFLRLSHKSAEGDGRAAARGTLRRIAMVALVLMNVIVIAAWARPVASSISALPPGGPEWTKSQTNLAVARSAFHRVMTAKEAGLAEDLVRGQLLGLNVGDPNAVQDNQSDFRERCPNDVAITSYAQARACTRNGSGKIPMTWPAGVKKLVAIMGNSFALQWVYEVQRLLPKDVRLVPFTITSCSPWLTGTTGQKDSHGNDCDEHRRMVIRALRKLKPGLVIVSYQRVIDKTNQLRLTGPLVERLLRLSPHVLFIGPATVLPPFSDCLRADRLMSRCNRLISVRDHRADRDLGEAVRAAGGNYVSTQKRICGPNFCPSFLRGYPTRRDGIHFSRWATRALAPWISEAIARAIGGVSQAR